MSEEFNTTYTTSRVDQDCRCCRSGSGDTTTNMLKAVWGNDVSISIQLSKKVGDSYEEYDLSDGEDYKLNIVNKYGDRIEFPIFIADNKIKFILDSQELESNVPYSIEVLWQEGPYDKRVFGRDMFMYVNSSIDATPSDTSITPQTDYEYNIVMEGDVCYISIGQIPDVDLSNYVTQGELNTQINQLWLDVSDQFVDNDELAYVVDHLPLPDMSSYVSKDELSQMSYVTSSALTNSLDLLWQDCNSTFIDESELNTALLSYINDATYDSNTHNILLKNGSTTIATIDASPFIIDGMVENVVVSNNNLVISFNTDAGKQDIIIPISSIFDSSLYYTKTEIEGMSYVSQSSLDAMSYVSSSELDTTLANASYVTESNLNTTLSDYVTSNDLTTTLGDYVTQSSLDAMSYVTQSSLDAMSYIDQVSLDQMGYIDQDYLDSAAYINLNDLTQSSTVNDGTLTIQRNSTSVGTFTANQATAATINISVPTDTSDLTNGAGFITINDIPPAPVPSNVVTSYDGSYIYCLTQQEYDDLETNQQLEPDIFYYINDATSNYVTSSQMTSAINTAIAGVTIDESNLVHKTGSETITGSKTFKGTQYFNGECQFTDTQSSHTVPFADNLYAIAKSGIFGRGSFIQAAIGQIIAPTTAVTNSDAKYDNQVNTILFQKCDGTTGSPKYNPSSLTTLAKIDTNGIYEGTTLLANKYVQSSTIRNIVQISQSDYNNLSTPDANTLYVIV